MDMSPTGHHGHRSLSRPRVIVYLLVIIVCIGTAAWITIEEFGLSFRGAHPQIDKAPAKPKKQRRSRRSLDSRQLYEAEVAAVRRDGGIDHLTSRPWQQLIEQGDRAYRASRFVEASRFFIAAAEMIRENDDNDERFVLAVGRLARLVGAMGRYKDADKLYQHARGEMRIKQSTVSPNETNIKPGSKDQVSRVVRSYQPRLDEDHPTLTRIWVEQLAIRAHSNAVSDGHGFQKVIEDLHARGEDRSDASRLAAIECARVRAADYGARRNVGWSVATLVAVIDQIRTEHGPKHPLIASAMVCLGQIHLKQNEFANAYDLLHEAATVHQPVKHPDNPTFRPDKSWEHIGFVGAGRVEQKSKAALLG